MTNLIIFDADSIIWTIAYKFRNKKLKNMLLVSLNKFINETIKNAKATHYIGFYGSKEEGREPNFRYALDKTYKAQRPEEPDWLVKWRPVIHEEMKDRWKFMPIEGMEADDACSIATKHYKDGYDKITVATADKDLKQIPNILYYNYTKHQCEFINEFDAAKALATQVLVGDTADNIKGLYKIGPVKAKALIQPCTTSVELNWTVIRTYIDKTHELHKKAVKTLTKETKTSIEESDWAKNKTDKQIQRKVRITSENQIKDAVDSYMPGGWKKYLKTQIGLLTLLTDCPDWFTVPIPEEYEVAEIDEGITVTDDFLFQI